MTDKAIEAALDIFYPFWRGSHGPNGRQKLFNRMRLAIETAQMVDDGLPVDIESKKVSWKEDMNHA